MAEGVATPDGKPLDLDAEEVEREFARVMSEPAAQEKAPPKRPERAAEPRKEQPRVKRGKAVPMPPKALSKAARMEGVKGIAQLAAGSLMLVSSQVKNPVPWQADAVVIASNGEQLAEAVASTAEADERFARVIDRICATGPYGALIAVTVSIGTQVARNHGMPVPGTHAPEELLKAATVAA